MEKESPDIEAIINPYKFPFVGCREDGEPFEYLLLNVKKEYVEIALLAWLVNKETLEVGEKVDLFIPTFLCPEYLFRGELAGKIISKEENAEFSGFLYKVNLLNLSENDESFDELAHRMHASDSLVDLLLFLIKDSAILKSGVSIYIKHLIPYFSRIVDRKERIYNKIEKHFLNDIQGKIQSHEEKLRQLYLSLKENIKEDSQIPIFIDLEEIRETMQSEISFSLFHVIFGNLEDLTIKSQYPGEEQYGYSMYIQAIKILEKRLYSNYNLIVFVYLKSL